MHGPEDTEDTGIPEGVDSVMVVESTNDAGTPYVTEITNYSDGESVGITSEADTGVVVDVVHVPANESVGYDD